ncbi:MAG: protein phosphatase 2C domain-containing protein [Alsobacter sp.]
MALRFKTLDTISHGPKPPNEDAHGATATAAWVIDGATGVTLGPDILAPSGAAWLAGTLSDILLSEGGDAATLQDLLVRAERAVSERFAAAVDPGLVIDGPDMPTGCLGLAVIEEHGLELAVIGDVSLLHRRADRSLSVLSDHAVEAFGERTMDALRRALRERPDEDPWPMLRLQIRENRRMANQPGGYNVVHPTLAWAHRVTRARADIAEGDVLLLASDGFFRLVDHFGMHDPDDLIDAALDIGLSTLVERLRAAEIDDRRGERAPRVKVHDDATAVLLRVETDNTN